MVYTFLAEHMTMVPW